MSTTDNDGETLSEREPEERPSQRLHGLYRADLRPFEPVSDAQLLGAIDRAEVHDVHDHASRSDMEGQLIDSIRAFQPDGQLHDLLLQTLNAQTAEHAAQPAERRNELLDQLQRLQDLYVLGDLTKAQYIMRRQALEEELQRQGPPAKPAIDRAKAPLEEFPRFWDLETEPAERRKLLLSLFEQIWAQNGQIVAVQPHDDFLPYFQATQLLQHQPAQGGAESGSDGGRTRSGHRIEIRL